MDLSLNGKIAVVTGGSRGIGRHIADALCAAGAVVAITGREAQTVEAAAARMTGRCFGFVCDQRAPEAIEAMAAAVRTELGAPDILVCNAGVYTACNVSEMDLETWNNVIQTNLTGTFLTVKAFLADLISKDRGDIFIVSSMSGKKGDPGASAYAASKFGLQGFAQSLCHEVRRHNVRVMVLNPGSVNTATDDGPACGKGVYLHAADLAATVVHLACLPGRTLIRDMDIWGTNP